MKSQKKKRERLSPKQKTERSNLKKEEKRGKGNRYRWVC